jgi:ribosomal protein S6--L-glutamate ligase
VIRTELALGGRIWAANITLTNRERMELPMLIGREALAGRVLVDAERSWLCGQPVFPKAEKPKPVRRKQPARLGEGR